MACWPSSKLAKSFWDPLHRLVVFAAGDDSTLLMLTLEKGELLEKPLKPKNASKPLAMALLDGNGTLVPPPQGEFLALVSQFLPVWPRPGSNA